VGERANLPRKLAVTLFFVAVATLGQFLIWPIPETAPFLLYYPAVIAASLYGEGIVAALLSGLLAQYLFVPPRYSFHLTWPGEGLRLLIFLSCALMIRQLTRVLARALAGARREIEARRIQESLLEESEARNRSVLENALDAVVAMDVRGMVTQWNAQAERTFGCARADAVGRRLSELIIPPRFRAAHDAGMAHFLATGEGPVLNRRIEVSALAPGGRELPVELTITPIRASGELHFYAFIRDISERRAAEEERTRLLAQLQRAVHARDEFISVASHELKTPITALKLQFQIAARQVANGDRRVFDEEMVRRRVATTNRQLDRMGKLIEDMLDVTRAGAGSFVVQFGPTDLSEVVREVAERFDEQLMVAGSQLSTRIEPGVQAACDRFRVEQVLTNLLTNAIKYGDGKPVEVSLSADGELARLSVSDHGIGIPRESLARIFQPFERAVSSENVSGMGLGLYITQQIVRAHGGRVRVESQPGKGSRFTVELPLIQGTAAAHAG
jgi:two-component system, LuxR family, sensor kinase FixL